MKTQKDNILENYLFDINISNLIYITLDKTKMEDNCVHHSKNFYGLSAFEDSKYDIAYYDVNNCTLLTILENGNLANSQFLVTSEDIRDYITIEDLTKYVGPEVADLVLCQFE